MNKQDNSNTRKY